MRALVTFTVVAVGLLCAVAACGSPGPSGDPNALPAVEATAVRRTAVAAVQRIIANNPTPTALPPATPMARPSCQNAIWWTEADASIGQARTVQGTIVAARVLPGGAQLLELGAPYPDPTGFGVVVASGQTASLAGKTICVQGRILSSEGRPVMQIADAARIVVVD